MAGSRAGLKKVTKMVRGKKETVKRSYWVKATDAAKGAGRFLNKHKGKIAGAVALTVGAHYMHKQVSGAKRSIAFYKAAQQAGWTDKDARNHARKGYKQGVSRGGLWNVARAAARGAAGRAAESVRGAATKAGSTRAGAAVGRAAGHVSGAASRAWNSVGSPKGVGTSMRAAAGRAASAVKSGAVAAASAVRSGVRKAGNRARGQSTATGIKVRRGEARGWEGSGVRQRHAQSRFADI